MLRRYGIEIGHISFLTSRTFDDMGVGNRRSLTLPLCDRGLYRVPPGLAYPCPPLRAERGHPSFGHYTQVRNASVISGWMGGPLLRAILVAGTFLPSWMGGPVLRAPLMASKMRNETTTPPEGSLALQLPFSLKSTIQFGLIFLALEVVGTLAQWWLGRYGFYGVSMIGGTISSASAVASAASLAEKNVLSPEVAGIGAVLASMTSALVSLPLVARPPDLRPLARRIAWALGLVVFAGLVGAVVGPWFANAVAPLLPVAAP